MSIDDPENLGHVINSVTQTEATVAFSDSQIQHYTTDFIPGFKFSFSHTLEKEKTITKSMICFKQIYICQGTKFRLKF